jgi:integrase
MKNSATNRTISQWQKTPVANLLRHVQSGNYYARIRVRGKLIWKSLKTDRITVAKLRLSDFHKEERQRAATHNAVTRGQMTFGDALAAFQRKLESNPNIKPKTKEYYEFRVKALIESWPDLKAKDVSKISRSECESWSVTNAKKTSSSSHNHTVGLLRQVFEIAIEAGARYDNPALAAKRVKERAQKQIKLPESSQFEVLVKEIENSGSGFAKPSAELVQFLAYGGFRKSEAQNITWEDCDFERGRITVRGSPETGLKGRQAGETRVVPMIPDMRRLLETIQTEQPNARPNHRIMRVTECKRSITSACKKLGIPRFTHHDLRHLFATRCIEAGVDIPTVARWLGHRDGGALAMKTYGHLRDEHSSTMAQKVTFVGIATANTITPVTENSSNHKSVNHGPQNQTPAKAKAGYSYPWWASSNPLEVFWGQANEPVQIVPRLKYLESAKAAMEREVFEQELAEPQALIDELEVRLGTSNIEKLKAKISANQKQKAV